jgi:hypothetical protein
MTTLAKDLRYHAYLLRFLSRIVLGYGYCVDPDGQLAVPSPRAGSDAFERHVEVLCHAHGLVVAVDRGIKVAAILLDLTPCIRQGAVFAWLVDAGRDDVAIYGLLERV